MKRASRFQLVVLCFFVTLFAAAVVQAQEPDSGLPPDTEGLPIDFTPEERSMMNRIGENKYITDPPLGPVRACAEWDESIGIFTLWSNSELIDELQKDNEVYIITENKTWWLNWLSSHGIPTDNFHYSIYTRDFGPWFIWDGDDEFGLVDNIYNRPRPDDDVIPEKIALEYGVTYYGMDLVHTGGNYYTDGLGNAFSTQLVYKENPGKSHAEVLQIMEDYLGIKWYWLPNISVSIEHMDTFGKVLAPDRFIWGKFPDFSSPWCYCEAAYKYLKTLESPYGWPYKIQRMPLWDAGGSWTAYINALQTNQKIITCKYGTGNDAKAKAIYEEAAPGYNVVNVNAAGTKWGDSIHCRTRNFHKAESIRIYPTPHWESSDDDSNPYSIRAEVIPHPSTTLDGNPVIRWTTTGGAPFFEEPMTPTGNPDEYAGAIPAQPHGTMISYFIHAEDMAGRTKDHPFVSPEGMFVIEVEDDLTPPELDHDAIHGLTLDDWPFIMSCTSVDNTGIPDVYIEFTINGAPQPVVKMTKQKGCFLFEGRMDGAVALGDLIAYRILSVDASTPPNLRSNPPAGWNYFFINPKNAIVVIEKDYSPVSGAALVDICDDLGLNVHYTKDWPDDLSNYDVAMICLGMNPMASTLSYGQANELMSFMNAGGCAYMEGGNAWAQDPQSINYRPYFGIADADSGSKIESPIEGVSGTMTEGMIYGYLGENGSSDHLYPDTGAQSILECGGQVKAVSYATGTYQTVAASFQVADLVEPASPSHIKYLIACCLQHLGMEIDLIVHSTLEESRRLTLDLSGDPYGFYMLFYAFGPGYHPLGNAGIVRLDPGTLDFLLAGLLPADGKLSFNVLLPDDPALTGVEVFLQGYLEDTGSGQYYLTNRDRITLVTH
jgi:agmatine/peptidylarginine deiminase